MAVVVTAATDGCVPCGVAAGVSTYAVIAGTGNTSANSGSSASSPSPVSYPTPAGSISGPSTSRGLPPASPDPGSPPARAPPPPWLRPVVRLAIEVAKELANWDDRTASVVEAAEQQRSQSTLDQKRTGLGPQETKPWWPSWMEVFVPGYGNYGGPYRTEITYTAPPIDTMDVLFRQHDIEWAAGNGADADIMLYGQLSSLPSDPKNWKIPAPDPLRAKMYRALATHYFGNINKMRRINQRIVAPAQK